MKRAIIALTSISLVFATEAIAQSSSGRVTDVLGGVGLLPGQVPTRGLDPSSGAGADVPGGLGVKVGDKIIKFRGAVGAGDDGNNYKAGVGIPF
jgi:hypothetical protein